MASKSFAPNVIAAAGLSAAAVALLFASPAVTTTIRTAARDATQPVQRVAAAAVARADVFLADHLSGRHAPELRRLQAELAASERRARQLELEAAAIREQMGRLHETGPPPFAPVSTEPLVSAELIEAELLGTEHARQWRAGQFIDKGTADGIPESALVLEAAEPVIDQGATTGLEAGQPVYAGRCVVGRIACVGRWMSTVQPVTHPEYRGSAQIVRRGAEGSVFGPRGILEGTGAPLCRLRIIDATATVDPGDEVYTGDRDGTLPSPMYYGKVVTAELDPQTLVWDIRVQPAVRELEARSVCVLRRTLNR